jgi:hypothetical protein
MQKFKHIETEMECKDLTDWKTSGSFVFYYSSWDLSEKIEKQMYFSFRL